MDQIPHDYAGIWAEAESDEERISIWGEYRREVRLAVSMKLGLDLGVAGAIHLAIANPTLGASALLIVLLIALAFIKSR